METAKPQVWEKAMKEEFITQYSIVILKEISKVVMNEWNDNNKL